MKKKVNIVSRDILYMITPPMSGVIKNIDLELADIRMCLVRGAEVEEVLPSGNTVKLTLDNYMQDLSKKEFKKTSNPVRKDVVKEVVKEEPKKEIEMVKEVEVKEEPVVDEVKKEVVEEPKKEVKESSVVKEDNNKNRQKNNRKK